MVSHFRNLIVWKKAMELVSRIYKITALFPKEEIYGLTSQIRRCAVSIPSNISEGSQRGTQKDFSYFLGIAKGSAAELETQLLIAMDLGYISNTDDFDLSISDLVEIRKMIWGLQKRS
jgi:four helix bundle protein